MASRIKAGDLAGRLRDIREDFCGEDGAGEFARDLGVPEGTWLNYERGVAIPGEVLLAVIRRTGVDPAWLATGLGPRYRLHATD
jgi:hypothetical protein